MPDFEKLQGWAGPKWADKAWEEIGATLPKFFIAGQVASTEGKTFRAWDVWRKVLGKELERTIQLTGDCVAMSMADVAMAMQCIEIANGDRETFKPILCSYHYATSRVLIGRNQLKGGAGSVGSWMAAAVQKYGVLADDYADSPTYSGKLSDKWGDDAAYNGIKFRDFLDEGDNHVIRTASRVTDWSQLRDAVCNGHLGTIASNRGYNMKPDNDGFHRPSGSWSHQMSILGICDSPSNAYVAIGNQWGNMHGQLKDFETDEVWPTGMLRVRREDFEKKHLTGSAECFVYSGFDGYPDQSEDIDGLLI